MRLMGTHIALSATAARPFNRSSDRRVMRACEQGYLTRIKQSPSGSRPE
jgi:hypothetical protein